MRKLSSIVVASGTGLLLIGGAFSAPALAATHGAKDQPKVTVSVDADKNTATVSGTKRGDLTVSWSKVDDKRSKVTVTNEAGKVVKTKLVPTKVLDRVEAAADAKDNGALRGLLQDLNKPGKPEAKGSKDDASKPKADKGGVKAEDGKKTDGSKAKGDKPGAKGGKDDASKPKADKGGKKTEDGKAKGDAPKVKRGDDARPTPAPSASDSSDAATLPSDELNGTTGDDDQVVGSDDATGDDSGHHAEQSGDRHGGKDRVSDDD